MTLRALILAAGLAAVVPVNDWYFRNPFFYSQHLPIGVLLLLLVVLFTVVVNPILGRRRRVHNELLVVTGMLPVLGGVASSGLNRILATTMSGPARKLSTGADLQAYANDDGSLGLPHGPYVGQESGRLPTAQDAEFHYVVDGFWLGLQGGDASVGHRSGVEWSGAIRMGVIIAKRRASAQRLPIFSISMATLGVICAATRRATR